MPDHRIPDDVPGAKIQFPYIGDCFLLHRTSVAACQEALVIEGANLAFQGAGGPVLGGGFVHVPMARIIIFDTEQYPVMGPTQFVTQCVTDWKRLIKESHVAQIRSIKPFPEPRREHLRQRRQQLCSVDRSFGSSLLEFDDVPADLPAGLDLEGIHGSQDFLACLANQLAEFVDQGGELRVFLGQ
jgi:hypothetical protein